MFDDQELEQLGKMLERTMERGLRPLADAVARIDKNLENLDESMVELRSTVGTPGRFRRLEQRVAELEARLAKQGPQP